MDRFLLQFRVNLYMEKTLNKLSASSLRNLLIVEIEFFIDCLDNGTLEELEKSKERLKEIFGLLTEKELLEMAPLIWGRNSSKNEQEQGDK